MRVLVGLSGPDGVTEVEADWSAIPRVGDTLQMYIGDDEHLGIWRVDEVTWWIASDDVPEPESDYVYIGAKLVTVEEG